MDKIELSPIYDIIYDSERIWLCLITSCIITNIMHFSLALLDETDEEDIQRRRRLAEKAAAGLIDDAEVI